MDQDLVRVEERLENWGTVVRDGLLLGHCASAEHRYRPGGHEAREERRAPDRVVDVADGWVVERHWRELPDWQRWLLKLHYVRRMPRIGAIKWVAKRTGHAIKSWHYTRDLHEAMRSMKKSLDKPMALRSESAPQFNSLSK